MSASDVRSTPGLFPELLGGVAEGSRSEGMLPSQDIREIISKGYVRTPPYQPITERQIQPASLDLRLGDVGYRVQASFVPQHSTVEQGIHDAGLKVSRVDLTRPTVLEKGCVYIVPLLEELELPDDLSARANPKSSTGRLDVFTRLITDHGIYFDHVPSGYKGPLYAEITSRTFTVIISAGMTLNQLRFAQGKPRASDRQTSRLEKEARQKEEALVYSESGVPANARIGKNSIWLSVNLRGSEDSPVVAYQARKSAPVINLSNIHYYDPEEFWDARHDPGKRGLILEPGDFYILASKEKVSVPPDWAAEMVPMDQDIGEFRMHYAGFFDPGFGYGSGDIKGTSAVLEIRAHEVPFRIEHDQSIARLQYIPLLSRPDKIYGVDIGSSYQKQALALSKHFKRK